MAFWVGIGVAAGFAGGVFTTLIVLSVVADAWGRAMSSVESIQERAE
ncbi:MAG: hypothetical protein IT428_06035 [Planctomycetaceae bacterium]|nr:hypothetical protein [Planctomycetaceae bacterium]